MFIRDQRLDQQHYYLRMLGIVGSLTRLFSANVEPYIDYRIAENLFCKSFEADNLSRADVSADAKKGKMGIGIKTFLDKSGSSFEKIAEFNKDNPLYKDKTGKSKILKIAELRNQRLALTQELHDIDQIIYHCITRGNQNIYVYELDAKPIDLDNLNITRSSETGITFTDGSNVYRFINSKSTLYKYFSREDVVLTTEVEILEDPFQLLERLISDEERETIKKIIPIERGLSVSTGFEMKHPRIYLPLYSTRGNEKYVPEKSGLNQWRADGRPRNSNEVYIPIPKWVHDNFPDFFPPRKVAFNLRLSDGQLVSAAVCQDNGKALMSNPNSDLGEWLLRGFMNLKEKVKVTYDHLDALNVDSVVIDKIGDLSYEIDVVKTGSFEAFKESVA